MLASLVSVQLSPEFSDDLSVDMSLVSVNLAIGQLSIPRLGRRARGKHTLISVTFQSLTAGFVGSLLHWK